MTGVTVAPCAGLGRHADRAAQRAHDALAKHQPHAAAARFGAGRHRLARQLWQDVVAQCRDRCRSPRWRVARPGPEQAPRGAAPASRAARTAARCAARSARSSPACTAPDTTGRAARAARNHRPDRSAARSPRRRRTGTRCAPPAPDRWRADCAGRSPRVGVARGLHKGGHQRLRVVGAALRRVEHGSTSLGRRCRHRPVVFLALLRIAER